MRKGDLPGAVATGITRLLVTVLALGGLAWSAAMLPTSWRQLPLEQFSNRITRGETFPVDRLEEKLRLYRETSKLVRCNASASHDMAVVDLAIVRGQFDASSKTDAALERGRNTVVEALSCLPSDPYLWFSLFQIESLRMGLRQEYLRYLDMSYQVGPNEGWLAIPRNRAAFAILPALSETLQSKVIDEFCLLLRSELYAEAIEIFLGAARLHQAQLVKRMDSVPAKNRQIFAVQLARKGIDARIPGTSVVVR
ncbi:hypothetical protein [Bradyrhizobium japonicum]|uniref:hypothetical protein n=1 Tax=Bradyrhizobium japonicum TaxID=375 RepID=UPI000675F1AF|nr:hypothetical protein [Bradyrhizobium japonicum]